MNVLVCRLWRSKLSLLLFPIYHLNKKVLSFLAPLSPLDHNDYNSYYGTNNITSKLIAETSPSYVNCSLRWKGCSACPRDSPVRMWRTITHPSLKWNKNNQPTLRITAFCFINKINVLPVPGTGWRVTVGAAALLERTWGDLRDNRLGMSLQCPGRRRG